MVHQAVEAFRAKANRQVVLVLQGGGALGAYQGGVYQALHEAGVEPDWIIGTSIGAINAGLIAGNEPQSRLQRLREFWSRVEHKHPWTFAPAWTGVPETMSYWSTLLGGLPEFFRGQSRGLPRPARSVGRGESRLLFDRTVAQELSATSSTSR